MRIPWPIWTPASHGKSHIYLPLLGLVLGVIGIIAEGVLWLNVIQEAETTRQADWTTMIARWRLWINWPDTPSLVRLPSESYSDCFQIGAPKESDSSDEQPQHEVCLAAFQITKHEITFSQYDAYALSQDDRLLRLPNDQRWGRGSRPL